MEEKKLYKILFLFILVWHGVSAQKAEQNSGKSWVHPGGQKFIGMDFVNTPTGVLMNNGSVWYSGNVTNNGTIGFDTNLPVTSTMSYFAGDALQHISGSGTTGFYSVMFGSQLTSVAYSLEQSITVAHKVDFSKGVLAAKQTTPETMMNMLLLENGSICINASDNSYMDGFVSKTGNSAFTFPIGNGGFYRPASIGTSATTTDCFTARYLYKDPDAAGYSRAKRVSGISQISDKEYWVVNHTNGTGNGQLTLSWDVSKTSAVVPANLSTLAIVRWDGTKWIYEGNATATGNSNAGNITASVTGYGIFTLGTIVVNSPVAVNDTVNAYEDTALSGNVLTNDSVFDGKSLTLTGFSINGTSYKPESTANIPNVGTVSIAASGVFNFVPVLNYNGIIPEITYTISDGEMNAVAGKLMIKIQSLPEFVKTASKPVEKNDGTFGWNYTLTILNDTHESISNIQVEDNLDDVFNTKGCSYKITHISASGDLTANGLYNGSNIVKTLIDGSSIPTGHQDSICIEVNVDTRGQNEIVSVYNQATLNFLTSVGKMSMKSRADNTQIVPTETQTDIPVSQIIVPDGFSPNGDGINDMFVIGHPMLTKVEIQVLNRNGNPVYESSDYQNNWAGKGTGTLLGTELKDGTYYCSYKLTSISTGQVVDKGVKFITIRR
jgi:gliding motility-associated-like protein